MKMLQIAEICGIHAGDGYLRNDGKRIELDISGAVYEKDYYDKHVVPVFSAIFGLKIDAKLFPHRNTYGFVIRNKKIVEKIHSLGFPYGKKAFDLSVPKFVLKSKNKQIKCMFLRGVFDTDGCITFDRRYSKAYTEFKRKYHTYPRIIITTISERFFMGIQVILKDLGINFWAQIHRPKRRNFNTSYRIWIRGKSIEKWMEMIGSKNPSKLSRYIIWKKHGFCPANIYYEERLRILNGEINPKIFYGLVA